MQGKYVRVQVHVEVKCLLRTEVEDESQGNDGTSVRMMVKVQMTTEAWERERVRTMR